MSRERDQALGRYIALKKRAYEAGVKAQSLLNDIYDETNTLLNGKDFTQVDFKKILTLSNECMKVQHEFFEIKSEMENLNSTYQLDKED